MFKSYAQFFSLTYSHCEQNILYYIQAVESREKFLREKNFYIDACHVKIALHFDI